MTARRYHKGEFVRTVPMHASGDALSARWNLHAGSIAEILAVKPLDEPRARQYVLSVPWSYCERWVVTHELLQPTVQPPASWPYIEALLGWSRPAPDLMPLSYRIFRGWLPGWLRP